jgi:hypothetical protein
MSHREMITLKLQMGIDPSAPIAPNVLMAMWQQLKFESEHTKHNQTQVASESNSLTNTPMVV